MPRKLAAVIHCAKLLGSINKAALNLYVSQSTLSRAVQEVEAQIGISLFQRTNKGAIPTHDGLEFIERARRLLLALNILQGRFFVFPFGL